MSWKTYPQCLECWDKENPNVRPHVLVGPTKEICCDCGIGTYAGIYTRKDSKMVKFPRKEEE